MQIEKMIIELDLKKVLEIVEKEGKYLEDIDEFNNYYVTKDENNSKYILIHKGKFKKFLFDNRNNLNELFELIFVGYMYKKYTGRWFNYQFSPDFDYLISGEVENLENILDEMKIKYKYGIITDYLNRIKFVNLMSKANIIFVSGLFYSKMMNMFNLVGISTFYFEKAYKDNRYYIYKTNQFYKKRYKVYIIVDNAIIKEMIDYLHPQTIFWIWQNIFDVK